MVRDITDRTPVGHIAAEHPELIRELDRLGIDYCCGGSRTLGEVAERAGYEPGELSRRLADHHPDAVDLREAIDWTVLSMTDLADHIETTHHAYARETLERLTQMVERCVEVHAAEHPELLELQRTLAVLREDMIDHLVREERVLFPWLRRLERPTEIQTGPPWSVRRPIDCMIHDHEDVAAAFARIHELTDDLSVPEGACVTWASCYRLLDEFERDTRMHIHKENNVLFPAGVKAERIREGRGVRPRGKSSVRGGFTLIELLVVVAIMAMLIGLLLPALASARSAGRSVVCLANSRSLATALTIYADDDRHGYFPTARMPGMAMGGNPAAPFQTSWIYLLAPYIGYEATLPEHPSDAQIRDFVSAMAVCRCPEDRSGNWDAVMMPRLASYGINAYLTPNHPPHWGVRPASIGEPSHTVIAAELAEEMGSDHFMPMYWGDPPAVVHPMMQVRQWDAARERPRVIQHTRHGALRANYVFADGHAGAHAFADTWRQTPGSSPTRNWYDPVLR